MANTVFSVQKDVLRKSLRLDDIPHRYKRLLFDFQDHNLHSVAFSATKQKIKGETLQWKVCSHVKEFNH